MVLPSCSKWNFKIRGWGNSHDDKIAQFHLALKWVILKTNWKPINILPSYQIQGLTGKFMQEYKYNIFKCRLGPFLGHFSSQRSLMNCHSGFATILDDHQLPWIWQETHSRTGTKSVWHGLPVRIWFRQPDRQQGIWQATSLQPTPPWTICSSLL